MLSDLRVGKVSKVRPVSLARQVLKVQLVRSAVHKVRLVRRERQVPDTLVLRVESGLKVRRV